MCRSDHYWIWLQVWWTLATIHHVLLRLFHPLQLYSAFWKHSRRRENDCNKFKCNNNFETEVYTFLKALVKIVWNIFTRWENKDKDKERLTREELLFKYFDLLDDDEILSLYSIYENDFKMFGYTFQFRGLRLNLWKCWNPDSGLQMMWTHWTDLRCEPWWETLGAQLNHLKLIFPRRLAVSESKNIMEIIRKLNHFCEKTTYW